jgi:prevent-host-death family protein
MLITNISEAKARLSSLIEKVKSGEDVIIGKAGRPVARLVKYDIKEVQRKPGVLKGKIKIEDDFDDLPPDIAKAFGMED